MDKVTEVGIWLMACAIGGVIGTDGMQGIDTVTEIVVWLIACAIGGVVGTVIFHATRVTVAWIIAKIRGRG